MTTAHLFSGIGGFALAADWIRWQTAFHCEWDPFCQTVLKHYWPQAEIYGDITKTDFTLWRGRIDLLTGGFPCQPFSTAGQRKGTADDRYLWPAMLRAIREIAPRFIVGENVFGIYSWNNGLVFETVCADLESEGYEVTPLCIPACATGVPHRRERWWFVAHAQSTECQQPLHPRAGRARLANGDFNATHTGHTGLQRDELGRTLGQRTGPPRPITERFENEHWPQAATRLCRLDDGLPRRLDAETLYSRPQHAYGKWRKESLKAYGNAIVPQVAHQIYQAIAQTMTNDQ